MKVIFLDCDGVLNHAGIKWEHLKKHAGGRNDFIFYVDPICVARLNHICRETGAFIVLSSSWRKSFDSIHSMNDCMHNLGVEQILIDMTGRNLWDDRGAQIKNWLAEHPKVKDFVVIDDSEWESFSEFGPRFIQTTWENGLQSEHVKQAIVILNP